MSNRKLKSNNPRLDLILDCYSMYNLPKLYLKPT
jgi:hypothetical protein